jgi:hypothetical protein
MALAVLHFTQRERQPDERSFFLGAWTRTSTMTRTVWAFTELAVGGAFLLW